MTVEELTIICAQAIKDGFGKAEVYFDTEAKTFDYHMALVGRAFTEGGDRECDPMFILYEKVNL